MADRFSKKGLTFKEAFERGQKAALEWQPIGPPNSVLLREQRNGYMYGYTAALLALDAPETSDELTDEKGRPMTYWGGKTDRQSRLEEALRNVRDHGCNECVECSVAISRLIGPPEKTFEQSADSPLTSDKCEHNMPRKYCTAVHAPKCLVAGCPEPTADGQAMCAEHQANVPDDENARRMP